GQHGSLLLGAALFRREYLFGPRARERRQIPATGEAAGIRTPAATGLHNAAAKRAAVRPIAIHALDRTGAPQTISDKSLGHTITPELDTPTLGRGGPRYRAAATYDAPHCG